MFLQLQYRFGVFGIVSLLATWVLVIKAATERWPARSRQTAAVGAVVFAIAFIPTKEAWTTARAPGGNPLYADVYPALLVLHDACEKRPGVVLAAIDNGHWVRYHTRCSVIGNVFLLTEEHARKRLEAEALLDRQATRLPIERPDIAYVLVNNELELFVASASAGGDGRGVLRWKGETLPALTRALLGPEESLPPAYRVLWTSYTCGRRRIRAATGARRRRARRQSADVTGTKRVRSRCARAALSLPRRRRSGAARGARPRRDPPCRAAHRRRPRSATSSRAAALRDSARARTWRD